MNEDPPVPLECTTNKVTTIVDSARVQLGELSTKAQRWLTERKQALFRDHSSEVITDFAQISDGDIDISPVSPTDSRTVDSSQNNNGRDRDNRSFIRREPTAVDIQLLEQSLDTSNSHYRENKRTADIDSFWNLDVVPLEPDSAPSPSRQIMEYFLDNPSVLARLDLYNLPREELLAQISHLTGLTNIGTGIKNN